MCGLAVVIEFFAQSIGDLRMDFGSRDRAVVPLAEAQRKLHLTQVVFSRRCHVGVLQLAGEWPAVERRRAVYLAERSSACRSLLEIAKLGLPVDAELARHPPSYKRPTHRWRVRL